MIWIPVGAIAGIAFAIYFPEEFDSINVDLN